MGSRRSAYRRALLVALLGSFAAVGAAYLTRGRGGGPGKASEPGQTRPLVTLLLRCPGPTVRPGGEWRTKVVKVEKPIPIGASTPLVSEIEFPEPGETSVSRIFGGDIRTWLDHPRHADLTIVLDAFARGDEEPSESLVFWDGPAAAHGMPASEADRLVARPDVRPRSFFTTPGATRWRLTVTDRSPRQVGYFHDWELKFLVARPPFAHDRGYYRRLLFGGGGPRDPFRSPNAADYFREVSRGKFTFREAGVYGPVTWDGWDGSSKAERCVAAARLLEGQGFDFRPFDANHDGLIDVFELTVLVIHNERDVGVGWADTDPAGTALERPRLRTAPGVAFVTHRVDFESLTHELAHAVSNRVVDLYGDHEGLSHGLTLMSTTMGNPPDDRKSLYLDAWHRGRLGWFGGARQPGTADGGELGNERWADARGGRSYPLLFHKPGSGGSEYYVFEYRDGSGYDNGVGDHGVVAWHVREDAKGDPFAAQGEPKVPGHSVHAVGPDAARGARRAWKPSDGRFGLRWADGSPLPQTFWVQASPTGQGSAVLRWSKPEESDSPSL
jgi:M6 family metalloprotease-like protein